ncbi:pentapeptide repeat-containing protein [Streptomyces sp. NPDC059650]|uniref:pentapeptide repeat-containing protein n=1 Tax=Streptomyces sp. NPDC059650 TaxID=3346896 RepID=UPI0036D0D7C3
MSTGRILLILGIAIALAALALYLLLGPIAKLVGGAHLQAITDNKEQIEAKNTIRQTLVHAAGGIVLVCTLAFSAIAAVQSYATLQTQQSAQIADRYTKAVDQLGNKDEAVRAAAIFALERLSRDSDRDHDAIIQTISTFARNNTPRPSSAKEQKREQTDRPRADIDAAILVLGRRDTRGEIDRLRLERIYLPNSNLRRLRLPGTLLHLANLSGVNAGGKKTDLRNVDLSNARLTCADFRQANISSYDPKGRNLDRRTNMQYAHLIGADLKNANLQGALMRGAELRYAHLEGADLRYTKDLTADQLAQAYFDKQTKLPKRLENAKPYTGRGYQCWNRSRIPNPVNPPAPTTQGLP